MQSKFTVKISSLCRFQEFDKWDEVCPNGGYPTKCDCKKNDCEIEAWQDTVFGQNFCYWEGNVAPPKGKSGCKDECESCSEHGDCNSGCCLMDTLGKGGACRKSCEDEFGRVFEGGSGSESECQYVKGGDNAGMWIGLLVYGMYFCALFGPTMIGGCLFCYACRDSDRKRKAYEEKKR